VELVRNCCWNGSELHYRTKLSVNWLFCLRGRAAVSKLGELFENKVFSMISIAKTNCLNNRKKISLNTKIVLLEHILADIRQAPKARLVTEE